MGPAVVQPPAASALPRGKLWLSQHCCRHASARRGRLLWQQGATYSHTSLALNSPGSTLWCHDFSFLLQALLLSPQALAHPCPAALSSLAPRNGPELGAASLHDRAACTAPGHLRPGCCSSPSPLAGEHTGDPLHNRDSVWPKGLVEGGCAGTHLLQSQSSGKWNFEAWLPALLAPQWLQAALGKGAKLLFLSN